MTSPYVPPGRAGRNIEQYAEAIDSQVQRAFTSIYGRTAAEIAAGVTPVDYQYPELNVLRYGTNTTPGTTDMTTAIQKAINVAVQKESGATVYIPEGVYSVGELVLKYRVSLLGACPQAFSAATSAFVGTVLKLADNTNAPMFTNDLESDEGADGAFGTGIDGGTRRHFHISIENILFDGNGNNNTSTLADIFRLRNAWGVSIRKCGLYNCHGFGVRALDCNVIEIVNNSIIRAPIYWEHVADSLIAHNQLGVTVSPTYPVLWITGRGGSGPGGWQTLINDNFIYNNANNAEISQPTFTVDTGTDVITTSAAHGWADETPIVVTTTGSAPGGITSGKTYYWKSLTTTTGKLATSRANLTAGTYVDITSAGSGTHTIGVGENCGVYLNDGVKWSAFNSNRIDQTYGHGVLARDTHECAFVGNIVNGAGLGNATGQSGFALRASTKNQFRGNAVNGGSYTSGVHTTNQTKGFDFDASSTDNVGDLESQSFNHSTADVDAAAGYKIDENQEEIFLAPRDFGAVGATSAAYGGIGTNRREAMLLDASSEELIGAWFKIPRHWKKFRAEALCVNAGAGSGNFVLSVSGAEFAAGDDTNVADPTVSALETTTAGARDVVVSTAFDTEFACTPGKYYCVRLKRVATEAADTLANDIGVIGVKLTRA